MMANGTRRPGGRPACAWHRPGRRGHHRLVQLQRDRQRDPARRRDARFRGHPRGRLLHGPAARRGGDHAADEGDHARPPVRPHGRHGSARRDRPRATAWPSSRTPPRRTAPTYRGRRAGQFGPAMFSLYATKNLMTGEGGFATTDDDDVADRLRLFRNHGMEAATTTTSSAPTTSRRTSRPPSGSPSSPASTSGPRAAAAMPRYLTEHLAGYRTPARAGGPRARLAPVHDALSRASGRA